MSVRVGVQLHPQHADFAELQRAAHEADEMGVDTIYTWDHFYPLYGDPDGRHYEAVVTLTAIACATQRARISGLVFCNSYRNPQYLANVHGTLDHASGGRVILGVGAGWFERDYQEYGYEFGTAPDRLRALRRDLPLIKQRLAKLNPQPVGPMPILVAGAGEKVTLRIVAEHADMWHSWGDVETYQRKSEILAEHCAKVGRDPGEIERIWGSSPRPGDPAQNPEQAEAFADAGISEVMIGIGGDGRSYDLGPLRELIQWRDRYNQTHP